jgi:23S rRNA U2552 (ribose-2'-O)-methylase RlmE/FtsJ
MERRFVDVRLLKPEASRQQSTELYLLGKNFGPES